MFQFKKGNLHPVPVSTTGGQKFTFCHVVFFFLQVGFWGHLPEETVVLGAFSNRRRTFCAGTPLKTEWKQEEQYSMKLMWWPWSTTPSWESETRLLLTRPRWEIQSNAQHGECGLRMFCDSSPEGGERERERIWLYQKWTWQTRISGWGDRKSCFVVHQAVKIKVKTAAAAAGERGTMTLK